MNASQVLAWLICLLLAFFGALLAINARTKVALLEKNFDELNRATADYRPLLAEVQNTLQQIEQHLRSSPAGAAERESQTRAELDELRRKIEQLEQKLRAPQAAG